MSEGDINLLENSNDKYIYFLFFTFEGQFVSKYMNCKVYFHIVSIYLNLITFQHEHAI